MKLQSGREVLAVAAGGALLLALGLVAHLWVTVVLGAALVLWSGLNAWWRSGRRL